MSGVWSRQGGQDELSVDGVGLGRRGEEAIEEVKSVREAGTEEEEERLMKRSSL